MCFNCNKKSLAQDNQRNQEEMGSCLIKWLRGFCFYVLQPQ